MLGQLVRLAAELTLAECAGQDLQDWQCTSLVGPDTLYKNSNKACTICRRHMFAKSVNKALKTKQQEVNKTVLPASCAVALYGGKGGGGGV